MVSKYGHKPIKHFHPLDIHKQDNYVLPISADRVDEVGPGETEREAEKVIKSSVFNYSYDVNEDDNNIVGVNTVDGNNNSPRNDGFTTNSTRSIRPTRPPQKYSDYEVNHSVNDSLGHSDSPSIAVGGINANVEQRQEVDQILPDRSDPDEEHPQVDQLGVQPDEHIVQVDITPPMSLESEVLRLHDRVRRQLPQPSQVEDEGDGGWNLIERVGAKDAFLCEFSILQEVSA